MNRIDVVQQLLDKVQGTFYLEIGVDKGKSFLPIQAKQKIGVDPSPKIEHSNVYTMTSDAFFQQFAKNFPQQTIDVCFIDGMHTYEQALQDFNNAFAHLSNKGFIVMHDCNPPLEETADPANSHYPEQDLMWCGDVWKAIIHLRSTRKDLHIFVLNTDFGIGVIMRGKPENTLSYTAQDIQRMTYEDLDARREYLLNLKSPDSFTHFLHTL